MTEEELFPVGNLRLVLAVAEASVRRVADFKPQELANTAWAFASAVRSDVLVFAAGARVAERRVGEFTS